MIIVGIATIINAKIIALTIIDKTLDTSNTPNNQMVKSKATTITASISKKINIATKHPVIIMSSS